VCETAAGRESALVVNRNVQCDGYVIGGVHTSSMNRLPRLPSSETGVSLRANVACVPADQGGAPGESMPLASELAVLGLITYGPP